MFTTLSPFEEKFELKNGYFLRIDSKNELIAKLICIEMFMLEKEVLP